MHSSDSFHGGAANPTSEELFETLREEAQKKPFDSVIELSAFAAKKAQQMNQRGVPEFLGLSPDQMHKIIYRPFSFEPGPVAFVANDQTSFEGVPIIQEAIHLLNQIGAEGGLKATQKGNLPRVVVRELWERFYKSKVYPFPPTGEEDCRPIFSLRYWLQESGYIKKRQGKFSLTRKGQHLRSNNELYRDLFQCAANRFNWGYGDRYAELPLLQQTLEFHLFVLTQKARDWIATKDLGLIFFNAFPTLEREVRPQYREAKDEIISCFKFRFLHRFAERFGLVEFTKDSIFATDPQIKATAFFQENFICR